MGLHGEKLAEALDLANENVSLFRWLFDLDLDDDFPDSKETRRELRKLLERLVDMQVNVLFSNNLPGNGFQWIRIRVFNRICKRLDGQVTKTALPRWRELNPEREPLDDEEVYMRAFLDSFPQFITQTPTLAEEAEVLLLRMQHLSQFKVRPPVRVSRRVPA
jgi:hypothetical protein